MSIRLFLLLWFWACANFSIAQTNTIVGTELDLNINLIRSSINLLSWNDLENSDAYQIEVNAKGFSEAYYWARLTIENQTDDRRLFILSKRYLDHIVLVRSPSQGKVRFVESGNIVPVGKRDVGTRRHGVSLDISPGKKEVVYLGLRYGNPFSIKKITLVTEQGLQAHMQMVRFIIGSYLGIAFVLFVYNLFFYLSGKDKTYLFYILFLIVSSVSILLVASPVVFILQLPPVPNVMRLLQSIITLAALGFIYHFLNISEYPSIVRNIAKVLGSGLLLFICTAAFLPIEVVGYLNLISPVTIAYLLGCTIYLALKRDKSAQIYLIGLCCVTTGVLTKELYHRGYVGSEMVGSWSAVVGVACEMIFMSLAIGQRLRERLTTLFKDLEESKRSLQEKVKQRTEALERQNHQLENEIAERRKAEQKILDQQKMLVESEKMSSLGLVAAGMAHEINNPLAIVLGFADHIKRRATSEASESEIETIQKMADKIITTTGRISKIIRGLNIFARNSSEDPFSKNDFKQIIDDALELTAERVSQSGINLTVDITDDPLWFSCRVEQVTLVILNLVNNAIDASAVTRNPTIEIKVWVESHFINLKIKDSGQGVPEAIKGKIFDPFFTTKEVGKGTGLGLSISKGIVDDHNGTIGVVDDEEACNSFLVRFPMMSITYKQAAS